MPNSALADPQQAVLIDAPEFASELSMNLATAFSDPDLWSSPDSEPPKQGLRTRGKRAPAKIAAARDVQFPDSATIERLVTAVLRHTLSHSDSANTIVDPGAIELFGAIDRLLPDARARHSESAIEKLVDALVETHDPLAGTMGKIDVANARARVRFMTEVPTLSSEEVAASAGHVARNRSQTASRWKAERRTFSVRWEGKERYPAFQFKDGTPLPIVKRTLAALPSDFSPWETAFWFVSSNPWLDGKAPLTLLADGDRVVEAARQQAEAVIG